MSTFFDSKHQKFSSKRRFGICDTPPPPHCSAYIDETNGAAWIAIVENFNRRVVGFMPIDHCVEIRRADGTMDHRCDGCLYHESTIIFVELKQRDQPGSVWVKEGERQLRASIAHFEKTQEASLFIEKKAYIANSEKPKQRTSQQERMDRFFNETGYVLRIENRIKIEG